MARQGWGLAACIGAAVTFSMMLVNPEVVQGQAVIPSMTQTQPVSGPETNIIPSLTLSERYDSNVYFIRGSNVEDYVTTASPQLRVVHKRQLVESTVSGGATAEAYAKNPGLNYVAANGFVDLNLDGAMSALARGLKLQISDNFYYTPQLPSFAAPTGGGGTVPQSFVQGVQAQRANAFTNTGIVTGSYAMSPLVTLTSIYNNAYRHFGNPIAPTSGSTQPLINTMFQTVNSGPQIMLSALDKVTLLYQYQRAIYDGGAISGFNTHGGTVGWTRVLTPTLTSSLTGGGTVLSQSNQLQYVGSASLIWKFENTDAMVSYSRSVNPSFFASTTSGANSGAALVSQVVTVNAAHHITQALSVSINGNYAFSESTPDGSVQRFTSYSVTPTIAYEINRVMTASLSYTRSHFDQTFSSQESSFDRNMVLLRLFAEWK